MDESSLVSRLAQHRTLGSAPLRELEWLAAHGRLRHAEVGEDIRRDDAVMTNMLIVLNGHLTIMVDHGLGPRKVMEWRAGDVTGNLPYSRMGKPPGESVVDEAIDMVMIHRDNFPELIRECPVVTTTLVHLMLDRVRRFTTSDLHDEKMMSLGRLSAGLAHELNNPASAAARSGRLLAGELTRLEETSRALGAARLGEAQMAAVTRVCQACVASASVSSPIERADREEALADWLDRHLATPELASSLVDTAVTLADLDSLADALDDAALKAALEWLAADCYTRSLAADIERAATRMHSLVAAVKRSTYMDRAAVPEPVDLAVSLNDSIALLQHKARGKSVTVRLDLEPDLPHVLAIGGDLGQIWTNLIENALDSVSQSGHVTITAARRPQYVVVSVADDGPGIPEAIRDRIFDPFFTTKPVGQGTGLGLDIVRRLVGQNGGDIDVDSAPGRTVFRVTLPIAAGAAHYSPTEN